MKKNALKFAAIFGLSLSAFSSTSHAAFDYGHTCPTVEAALERLAIERENAAADALKSGNVETSLNTHLPVPGKYQGYWALDNCEDPDVTTIYTKYFSYSLIYGAEACLQKVREVNEGQDFTEINIPSDNLVLQTKQDRLITGFTQDDAPADLQKSWESNLSNESPTFTFKYCQTPPDPEHYTLHAPGLKLIRYMDHALEICDQRRDLSFADNSDCHHLLFVMADGNVDFELTKDEIKKAVLMLNYLAFINHNGAAIDNLTVSMDKAADRATEMADVAMNIMDADGNGTLTRQEIEDNYKKLPQNSPAWYFVQKKFKEIANIFPTFDRDNLTKAATE